jgi:hypothetical protein
MDSQAAPVQNTTKSIVVTGDAAKVGGGRRRGGRRTVKKSPQEGGSAPKPQPMNVIKQLTQQPGSAATAPLTGGAIKQKVSLVPAKTRNKTRVLLAPKQAVQTAHTSHLTIKDKEAKEAFSTCRKYTPQSSLYSQTYSRIHRSSY